MSDVVAVGLITGGVSLATAVVGGVVTLRVNRRTADTAIATAKHRGEAELQKLRAQQREERRFRRYDAYRQLITRLNRIDAYGTGSLPSDEGFQKEFDKYVPDRAAALLVATDRVAPVLRQFGEIFDEIRREAEKQAHPFGKLTIEGWRKAYAPRRAGVVALTQQLAGQMRYDIGGD